MKLKPVSVVIQRTLRLIMSVNVIEDKVNILCEVKRVTNFERIKQMSTKEMARLLGSIFVDCYEYTRTINGKTMFDSFDSIEEWLESEVDNNDQT